MLFRSRKATTGAKALIESKSFIAALKALRHPKASSSANSEAAPFQGCPISSQGSPISSTSFRLRILVAFLLALLLL
jgi:hypothetical protein